MSITLFKHTQSTLLGEPTPVAVPLGDVIANTSSVSVERADNVETGIWECTPGRWRRQVVQQEFCHFIQGRCTFTPDGGEPLLIEAGDSLMMPANCTGVWEVYETVRKTFVLML